MMDKHTFKICEAVALGLTHYYMGPNDRRKLTESEIAKARLFIPALPSGWMQEQHEWDACDNFEMERNQCGKEERPDEDEPSVLYIMSNEAIGRLPPGHKKGGWAMSLEGAIRIFPSLKKKIKLKEKKK